MMNHLSILKNVHINKDVWILASGSSMNFISDSFFDNKITIALNRVCKYFQSSYIVFKEFNLELHKQILTNKSAKIICSKHRYGNLGEPINNFDFDYYFFEHTSQVGRQGIPDGWPDVNEINTTHDNIVVSYSTITSALHIAAYMGAKNIIICGHDCGTIDGKSTIDGYYDDTKPQHGNEENYISWLGEIENHTVLVSEKLKEIYGCNIHSLNPFVNFNFEGRNYHPSFKTYLLRRNV